MSRFFNIRKEKIFTASNLCKTADKARAAAKLGQIILEHGQHLPIPPHVVRVKARDISTHELGHLLGVDGGPLRLELEKETHHILGIPIGCKFFGCCSYEGKNPSNPQEEFQFVLGKPGIITQYSLTDLRLIRQHEEQMSDWRRSTFDSSCDPQE